MNTDSNSGLAPVNGINLHYQVFGEGAPLILLHGGIGALEMFGENIQTLAQGRQVIGVDLQAHGGTGDIDRPMSYEAMADDIAGLITYLGLGQADVMGYSLGGGVAIQTAIRHPELVRKLVAVSAPHKRQGWYPEVLEGMKMTNASSAEWMKQTPMYAVYSAKAPRIEDWPVLLDKTGTLLGQEYDWSNEVAGLKMPVQLVIGDADSVRTSSEVEFFELLGGGKRDAGWDGAGISNAQLAILPGHTHFNIFMSPALPAAVIPFLDAPAKAS